MGRVLDRLAMLEKVITPEIRRQVLEDTGRVNRKACTLTHDVMLQVVLAMGILSDLPIRQVFKHSRRLRKGEDSPDRSSLCSARQRLGLEPVLRLFERVVHALATPDTPGAFYRNWRLVAIDGSVYNIPDTPLNEAYFGRPSGGDRGEGAFPQLRKLSLVELGTHAELAMEVGGYRTSEEAMVWALLKHLQPGMLLLWDRNFFSYKLWKALISRGIRILGRLQKGMILVPIRVLRDGSYLAKIYPSPRDREKDLNGLVVRVIKYTLNDPQRVGHGEEHTLITNILDESLAPARELIVLYHERWEHEMTYDEQKTHQDPPRITKPTHLRSETPEGVVQELYAISLAHFVIRFFMFHAAQQAGIDPDRLSFTGCFQILKCRLPECDTHSQESLEAWYQALLWELSQEQAEPRRNRVNPRVIKQKLRKWPKKRAEHYQARPLAKPFAQTIVMKT
jgi:hypothetical protein